MTKRISILSDGQSKQIGICIFFLWPVMMMTRTTTTTLGKWKLTWNVLLAWKSNWLGWKVAANIILTRLYDKIIACKINECYSRFPRREQSLFPVLIMFLDFCHNFLFLILSCYCICQTTSLVCVSSAAGGGIQIKSIERHSTMKQICLCLLHSNRYIYIKWRVIFGELFISEHADPPGSSELKSSCVRVCHLRLRDTWFTLLLLRSFLQPVETWSRGYW